MYAAQQGQADEGSGEQAQGGADDVVDAEFEDVSDDQKKSA